jgi:acetyl-CoA C-acetyltransferase
MGGLKDVEAYDLAALVLDAAVKKAGIEPGQVDEVILGQSYQNGEYVNIARMGLLAAGWPEEIAGLTIDRRCCSGLESIRLGASLILSGQADVVVAGGVESMSHGEFYLPGQIKWGVGGQKGMPKGHGDLAIWGLPMYDRIQRARVMSQPVERYGVLPSMMSWAETAASEEGISREACDAWALASHDKACKAIARGDFQDEIVPVSVPRRKQENLLIDRDENPREDTTLERLARLKPVLGGVCTAGNSSTENDGAAALVLCTEKKARELNIEPLGGLRSVAVAGADPRRAHLTVPAAVEKTLARARISLTAMDLVEVQEAFAAQVLADLKVMGYESHEKVNVNGSGISLGHPIACTGTRVMVSLLYEMQRRDVQFGLEAICGGGGLGIAAVIER